MLFYLKYTLNTINIPSVQASASKAVLMQSECLNFKVRLSGDYSILTNNFILKIVPYTTTKNS